MRIEEERRQLYQTLKQIIEKGKLTLAEAYKATSLLKANEAFFISPSLKLVPYVTIHTIRSVWFRTMPHICFFCLQTFSIEIVACVNWV